MRRVPTSGRGVEQLMLPAELWSELLQSHEGMIGKTQVRETTIRRWMKQVSLAG